MRLLNIFSDFYQPIEHFEVETSYCPGKFDLSINGKKFAGLAQSRIKNGIALYLGLRAILLTQRF